MTKYIKTNAVFDINPNLNGFDTILCWRVLKTII